MYELFIHKHDLQALFKNIVHKSLDQHLFPRRPPPQGLLPPRRLVVYAATARVPLHPRAGGDGNLPKTVFLRAIFGDFDDFLYALRMVGAFCILCPPNSWRT